jgi:hypothetical protein
VTLRLTRRGWSVLDLVLDKADGGCDDRAPLPHGFGDGEAEPSTRLFWATTAACRPALPAWTAEDLLVLGDLGGRGRSRHHRRDQESNNAERADEQEIFLHIDHNPQT